MPDDISKTQVADTSSTINQVLAESILRNLASPFHSAITENCVFFMYKIYAAADNQLIVQGTVDQASETFIKVADSELATVDALKITSQSFSDIVIARLDTALTKVNDDRADIGVVIYSLN